MQAGRCPSIKVWHWGWGPARRPRHAASQLRTYGAVGDASATLSSYPLPNWDCVYWPLGEKSLQSTSRA